MHDMLTKENYAKRNKSKKNQNSLYMIASVSSRRYGSYKIYLKNDSPHQIGRASCRERV